MAWVNLFFITGGAIFLVGTCATVYQVYRLVAIDAETRGFKHPRFWGFFSLSGNSSGGLVLYLIGRRNYPILAKTAQQQREMDSYRKRAVVGLSFLCVGAILLVIAIVFS